MKEINLRDYYPFYITDTIVEVPDEVADLLYQYKLKEAAYERRMEQLRAAMRLPGNFKKKFQIFLSWA